ncbi:Uncharacterized protein HZ326_11986 [Fusarium oxysporum f. sp. albedinis]|nr:Uncharacterized protein HZ326_11986 [Fusarium oxysporum f. sp. albedinis]
MGEDYTGCAPPPSNHRHISHTPNVVITRFGRFSIATLNAINRNSATSTQSDALQWRWEGSQLRNNGCLAQA